MINSHDPNKANMHKVNSFSNMMEHQGNIIAERKVKKLSKRLHTMEKYHQNMVK